MRTYRLLVASVTFAALASGLLALPAAAQEDKLRIAVVDFDTDALHASWRYGWSWTNLSRSAADNLATSLAKSGKFRVIERQQLDQVLAEQNLGDSGRVDPSTAANIGKILGVQLIVVGSVAEFDVSEKSANIPQVGKWKWGHGVGGSLVTGKAKLNARLVDTTTAEILGAYEGSGSYSFGKGEFAGASLGTDWNAGMASKVLDEAIQQLTVDISSKATGITPATVRGGLEAKVAKVGDDGVYLNIGSGAGIKAGDRFEIKRMGEQITDPDSGEVLGGEETVVGTIEIVKVMGEKLSVGRPVSGSGFAVGDKALMK